ncbi:sulfite exporter TauE/SafE family protein [Falsiruegeria litorea]|uniref:Probable membrane transporter protein n=1 Tax=Falsiruegeria litorea TaxID=1280831 RepID=A0ABS5WN82_9RHOB|nr:sulfite exporter TauE/SafE family protein [Falsiruegeria litorea]MBT3140206.1 sulfite exporter TauE/SafE family protein [Falsiruegeria litorea]MBT8169035.1 sulfite exporter TauE/SafE family protein [Falsiruegeria litorea]
MTSIFSITSPSELALIFLIATLGGLIKGLVGFAMPMVLIAGLTMIVPPDWALAGVILPAVVANGMQALHSGKAAAIASVLRFRVFLLVGLVFLLSSAQLVTRVEPDTFMLMIAVPVVAFVLMQLLGVRFRVHRQSARLDAFVGAIAGFIGGMSGVWGPPTVAYLTALDTPKQDQMRVQGVVYGLGAVALAIAHVGSGVLRMETLPFSMLLVLPVTIGMWLGGQFQDKIDQAMFRKLTLLVLLVAGLNLLRRALLG